MAMYISPTNHYFKVFYIDETGKEFDLNPTKIEVDGAFLIIYQGNSGTIQAIIPSERVKGITTVRIKP